MTVRSISVEGGDAHRELEEAAEDDRIHHGRDVLEEGHELGLARRREAVEEDGVAEDLGGDHVGPHVAAAAVGCGVGQGHALGAARVVSRDFQALDLHGQLGPAVLGRQALRAQGQLGPDSPPVGRVRHPVAQLAGLAPAQALVPGARFAELHGAAEGAAHGDGVEAQLVAGVIGFGDGGEVADAQVGAEGPDRLVFGPFAASFPGLRGPAAADRAFEAGALALEQRLGDLLAARALGVVEHAAAEVLGREHAVGVDDVDQDGRAQDLERFAGHGILVDDAVEAGGQVFVSGGIGDGDGLAPGGGDGLQVLGAHDGAQSRRGPRPGPCRS